MRRIGFVFIFLLTTTYGYGQVHVTKAIMGEYLEANLYSDSVVRAYIFTGQVIFQGYNIGGRKAIDAAAGFNQVAIMDDQHYVWVNNRGTGTCVRVDTDTTGAAFNQNGKLYGWSYQYLTISSDSTTIWYWGEHDAYRWYDPANGLLAIPKPIKIHQPAGKKWIKLACGNWLQALDNLGEVYEWNTGDSNYQKRTFSGTCIDIASSHSDFRLYVIHDYTGGNASLGNVYWAGTQWGRIGDNNSRTEPFPVKSIWNYPVNVKQVCVSDNSLHFIDSVNDCYGEGDQVQAEVGNGVEYVNRYTYPTIYSNTTAPNQYNSNGVIFKIFSNAKRLYQGNLYAFYNYITDMNDSLWFNGRDKSFVGGKPYAANNASTYPNALDVLSPTMVNPMGGGVGNYYNLVLSTLSAGSNQTIAGPSTTLTATGNAATIGPYGYTISSYQWTQVSGPSSTIVSPTAASTSVTNMNTSGVYTYRVVSTDNNKGTATSTVQVTVGNCNCITFPAGAKLITQ